MKKIISLALVLTFPVIVNARTPEQSIHLDNSLLQQSISSPGIPGELEFAGETVPLHYFDVRESLVRDLSVICYWHASMLYTIKLAHRFFPIIVPILQREGVPEDFKYLCVAESNLQQVVSPAKAVGFWQFLESTGKEYELEINNEIDERYHIEKATVAACNYLKKAYQKYGSWTMAGAVYNVGNANVDKQIERQKQHNYYDLLLPEETSRYIFRALAFKMVMSNPEKYGFIIPKEELFPRLSWTEVAVSGPVESWADFAAEHGTNYKIFKYFNPWLRTPALENKAGKTYVVKIPAKGFREIK